MFAVAGGQQTHQHGAEAGKLGTVRFSTSCAQSAQPAFLHGLALLHPFEFAEAIESFTAASTADPKCGIAFWGVGLSRWGNPFAAGIKPPAQLQLGRTAIESAKAAGTKTERERDYVAALD